MYNIYVYTLYAHIAGTRLCTTDFKTRKYILFTKVQQTLKPMINTHFVKITSNNSP